MMPLALIDFQAYGQRIFYMHFPADRTAHTTTFDRPVVDHWMEWKITQTANASIMQDWSAMQEDPNLYNWVLHRLRLCPDPAHSPLLSLWICCLVVWGGDGIEKVWDTERDNEFLFVVLHSSNI